MSLDKEFEFYKKHQDELLKEYDGKFLVIFGEKVVGSYNTEIEAYTEAQKTYVLGTFLIQHCLPGTESHTQTYYSQVAFP